MSRPTLLTFFLAACLAHAACGGERPAANNSAQNSAQGGAGVAAPPAASGDVEFAREAFRRLAEGDASVEEMIDWDNLVTLGDNFGAEYRKANDAGRAEARRDFVAGFSSSFKEEGGAADRVVNWREGSREDAGTVVAADMPTGARLLLTVTSDGGQRKISTLAAERPEEPKRP